MVGVTRVLENKMRYRQKRKILLPPLCVLFIAILFSSELNEFSFQYTHLRSGYEERIFQRNLNFWGEKGVVLVVL